MQKRTNLSCLKGVYEVGTLVKLALDRFPDNGTGRVSVRKGTNCIVLGVAWDPPEPMLGSVSYDVLIAGYGHYILNHGSLRKVNLRGRSRATA